MTGCGTTTYTDPADFRANVPGVSIDLTLTGAAPFRARVTWLTTPQLTLASIDQSVSYTALVSGAPARFFLCFPMRGEPEWNGHRLARGDFVFQGGGEPLRQVAEDNSRWGLISIGRRAFDNYGKTLLGDGARSSREARFLQPRRVMANALLRLHSKACRLAFTKPDIMAHREVARAIEQDLIVALVNFTAVTKTRRENPAGA